jgi:hypothetical protein
LLHAWREWLAGHDITHLRLLGIEVLWWGRIGKALEFLGGLTVVIDLLGRARMTAFHTALRRKRRRFFAWVRGKAGRASAKTGDPVGLRGFFVAGTVVLALFTFAAAHYAYPDDPMPLPVLALFIVFAAPTLGGLVLGSLGYLLLEAFVVVALGQLRTREGLESRLKWFGLAILVIGFSMDLLSS